MFTPLAKAGTTNKDINRAMFETVQLALLNQNILAIEYKPRKGDKAFKFQVHPYSLLFYKGEFYLLANAPGKGMRHFALDGIRKADRLTERFEIPGDFSTSDFLDFLKVPFGLFHGEPISVKVVFGRQVPRKPRPAGEGKGYNKNDISFPGSLGQWPESFIMRYRNTSNEGPGIQARRSRG